MKIPCVSKQIGGYYVDKTCSTPYDFSKTVKTDSIIYIKCRLINTLSDDYYVVGEVSGWAIKEEMLIDRDTGIIELDMDIGDSFVITKKADDGSPDYSGRYDYSCLEDESGLCTSGENNKIVINSAAKYRITFINNNAITKIIVDCLQIIEPEWGVFYVIGTFTEVGGETWKIRQDMKLADGSIKLHLNAGDEFKLTEWCGVGTRPVWDHGVGYKYLTGSGAGCCSAGDSSSRDPNIKVNLSGEYRITFDNDSADRPIVIECLSLDDYDINGYNVKLTLNGKDIFILAIPLYGNGLNIYTWDSTPEQNKYCGVWPGAEIDGTYSLTLEDIYNDTINVIFHNPGSGQTGDLAFTLNSALSNDTRVILSSGYFVIIVTGAVNVAT